MKKEWTDGYYVKGRYTSGIESAVIFVLQVLSIPALIFIGTLALMYFTGQWPW